MLSRLEASAVCSMRSCPDPVTAAVLVGAEYLPVCFAHERDYADRYGPAEIHPLIAGTDGASSLAGRGLSQLIYAGIFLLAGWSGVGASAALSAVGFAVSAALSAVGFAAIAVVALST